MVEDMNVLILSCGTRNKIVQYFKKVFAGKGMVLAADCSSLAPALYEADQHFIVPKMEDEGYLDHILTICKTNNVKAILSLIDTDLLLIAENKQAFLDVGTLPFVPNYELIEMSFDKYKMFEYLVNRNFKTVKSYIDKQQFYSDFEAGNVNFPVFVKPIKGSASININKVTSKMEIEALFDHFDNLMIQEYMDGQEYGADVYIDMISGDTFQYL